MFGKLRCLGAVLVGGGFSLACSGPQSVEPVANERQSAVIPSSGFVPYPLRVNTTTQQPILGANGQYQGDWDGTLADLIAADAYAMCATTQSAFNGTFTNVFRAGTDEYLRYLKLKMGEVVCDADEEGDVEDIWIASRTRAECNVDSRTGTLARIEPIQRATSPYESFFDSNFQASIQGSAGVRGVAEHFAGLELEYADLNLCMAQYMREQLNSGQSLFTPSTDLTEILGVVRERAQLASLQYALLSKVLSWNDGAEPNVMSSAENDWLIMLRRWFHDVATPAELTRIGEDFATAVRLAIQSTRSLATTLERTAGQRPVGPSGFDRPSRDWGMEQPRVRLLNLLYGGDPIGGLAHPGSRGRGVGGGASNDANNSLVHVPAFVSADMRDPRVGTLLGLARSSDALAMKVRLEAGVGNGFDVPASAARLYRTVETKIRWEQCERATPGGCDEQEIGQSLPSLVDVPEFQLWQIHRVEPRNAEILVQALAEAFGDLTKPLEVINSHLRHRRDDGSMHLTGQHSKLQIDGAEWFHLDKDFGIAPFAGNEIALDYYRFPYFPERLELDAAPYGQGFSLTQGFQQAHTTTSYQWRQKREVGAVPALAFVREAIAEGSLADAFAEGFFDAAGAVLPELDAAIGLRSVIVRPNVEKWTFPCTTQPFDSGASCQWMTVNWGNENGDQYRVTSVTTGGDPMYELTLAPNSPQLHTVALDAASVGFDGVDRATLDGYATVEAQVSAYSRYAGEYEKRVYAYQATISPGLTLLLRGDAQGAGGGRVYEPVYGHLFLSGSYQASFGGELNAIGERVTAVLPGDWSRPAFDAFGLPVDWIPPADASLVGGQSGQPSYTYYLEVAKQAAEEATASVQAAIDNLILETEQKVELELAEQRAESIADIEITSLCGSAEPCSDLVVEEWSPPVPDCSVDDRGNPVSNALEGACQSAANQRNLMMPRFQVAQGVLAATTPSFAAFAGSEIEGLLVRQWNAIEMLRAVDAGVVSNARAFGPELEAANARLVAAFNILEQTRADIEAEEQQIDVSDQEVYNQYLALQQAYTDFWAQYDLAYWNQDRECGDAARGAAERSGYTYSNVWWEFVPGRGRVMFYESKSYNPGPANAQAARCQAETEVFNSFLAREAATVAAYEAQSASFLGLGILSFEQRDALVKARSAAESAYVEAGKTLTAANRTRSAQFTASLTELQQAISEVISSQVAIGQLQSRLQRVNSEAALEKDLAQKQADSRFGIQRKFRSYDMWRARALLESARRLAVAARRAVESHFVVDLSDLKSAQAFVESPSLWADEIYGSDLDAPSVVGLSAAPKIDGAIYANKLIDYVENLERFVQGYTVSYPTSLAEPDTEVLTLPGPDVRHVISGMDVEVDEETGDPVEWTPTETQIVTDDVVGWTFHCEESGAWLPHPGVGEFPLTHSLDTLCNTTPPVRPTRARYSFELDPWGRLAGSIGQDPLKQRHNVRWNRLGVNLVGTGILECELAADPLKCYAEPFLRYDLRHVGPAWTTNHTQEWRALNMPSASIEDAKALVAEEWLDPIVNSWNAPVVANTARGEFFGRSIGGAYTLELEFGPEVRIDRIERIQMLVQTRYWSRQE